MTITVHPTKASKTHAISDAGNNRVGNEGSLAFGNSVLIESVRVVAGPTTSVRITQQMRDVLVALVRAHGQLIEVEQLRAVLWAGRDHGPKITAVNVVISTLRRRLRAVGSDAQILCVSGGGYYLITNSGDPTGFRVLSPAQMDALSRIVAHISTDRPDLVRALGLNAA